MIRISVVFIFFLNSFTALSDPNILAVGDSLTEGYGLPKNQAYPYILEEELKNLGHKNARVVNAGTSGATTAFGIRTLKFHLKRKKPHLILYALGANDGLRGINPTQTEANIEKAIKIAIDHQVKIILAGMKAPPNYGRKFPKEFEAIYPRLAKKYDIPLIPFFLEGVAGVTKHNLPDGIHPNAEGYQIIAKNILPYLKKQL